MKNLLPLLVLLSGCSGMFDSYTLRPVPDPAGAEVFLNGERYASHDVNGIKTDLMLAAYGGESRVRFRLRVVNGTASPFELGPPAFSCSSPAGPGAVVDPEAQIRESLADEAALEPSALDDTLIIMDSVLGMAELASGHIDDSDRKARERERKEEKEKREAERAHIRERRKYWTEEVWRRTTLRPGESAAGEVICDLPEDFRAVTLRVQLPTGTTEYGFVRQLL